MWAEHKQLLKLVSGQLSANGIIQLGAQYTPAHDSICRRCRLAFAPLWLSFATFVPLSVCHLVSVKWNLRGEAANKSETASEGEGEKERKTGTVEQWEVDRGQWNSAGLSCSDDVSFANVTLSLLPSLFARK